MNRFLLDPRPMRVYLVWLVVFFFLFTPGCDRPNPSIKTSAKTTTEVLATTTTPPDKVTDQEPPVESTESTEETTKWVLPNPHEDSTLELNVSVPEKATVGETVSLEWTLTNRGKRRAEGLRLRCYLGPGLEHQPSDESNERTLASLEPGKSLSGSFEIRPLRPGSFAPSVEVIRTLASDWDGLVVEGDPEESDQLDEPKDPDLGPPLVDNIENLTKLHPEYPVWFDSENKSVVLVGMICQQDTPLELFACLRHSKEHESIVTVATAAYVVHAGLLATGIEPGNPVQFHPEYIPASGPEIEITVVWKDKDGIQQQQRAQEWIRNMNTGKAMQLPFVFAGSKFWEDEKTGERAYIADMEGSLICVSNFPSAVLDLAVKSSGFNPDAIDAPEDSDPDAALLFEGFSERIPVRGTPITLILKPKPAK